MRKKIKSVKKEVVREIMLPDGIYDGVWGGYIIEVIYRNETYMLETEIGIKGINRKVMVEVVDGVPSFDEINT